MCPHASEIGSGSAPPSQNRPVCSYWAVFYYISRIALSFANFIVIKYENESGSCVSTHYCNDDLDDIKTRLREIMADNNIIYRERELRSIKSIEEIKKYCADHGAVLVKISDRIVT